MIGLFQKLLAFRPAKFLFVGGVTQFFYFSLIYILSSIFKLGDFITIVTAYISAISLHFTLNKLFVFNQKEINKTPKQILLFFLLNIFNLLITLAIVYFIKLLSNNIFCGSATGVAVTMLFTYFVMRNFIFGDSNVAQKDS